MLGPKAYIFSLSPFFGLCSHVTRSLSFLSLPLPLFLLTQRKPAWAALVSLALRGHLLLGYEPLLLGCWTPFGPSVGMLRPIQKEAGCCMADSPRQPGAAAQGDVGLALGLCRRRLQSTFSVQTDRRLVLEQQQYRLPLVQLIIYCWENGTSMSHEAYFLVNFGKSDGHLCAICPGRH